MDSMMTGDFKPSVLKTGSAAALSRSRTSGLPGFPFFTVRSNAWAGLNPATPAHTAPARKLRRSNCIVVLLLRLGFYPLIYYEATAPLHPKMLSFSSAGFAIRQNNLVVLFRAWEEAIFGTRFDMSLSASESILETIGKTPLIRLKRSVESLAPAILAH